MHGAVALCVAQQHKHVRTCTTLHTQGTFSLEYPTVLSFLDHGLDKTYVDFTTDLPCEELLDGMPDLLRGLAVSEVVDGCYDWPTL